MITGKCKLTSNNHCLSSLSYTLHAHINVVGIIFSNFVLLLLFTINHSLLAVFSRHKCANDTKYRTDNRWYCLMMCYSFFFFHHYQLFSSSRLCWHVRVSYASIVIGSTGCSFRVGRVWLSLSIFSFI